MNAKYENIINKDRHKLEEVLPLSTPYALGIDVCSACNFKCKFCAPHYSKNTSNFKKQSMDKELFKKIIDDLSEFPEKIKALRPTGLGEPLVNKDLPYMLSYAKEKDVAEQMEIVTNGSLLNPTLNRELVRSGLDRIRISIEGISADAYYEIAGVKLDWDRFVYNIQDLYENRGSCEIYIKTVDAAVDTEEKKQAFFDIFGNITDKIFIDRVIPNWVDFDEINENFDISKDEGVHRQKIKNVSVCSAPFYYIIIDSSGHVVSCCADWQHNIVLGNVNNESLMSIWNGEKYLSFLISMLKKGRKECNDVCAKCVKPCYMAYDNIDEYADILLPRYEALYKKYI